MEPINSNKIQDAQEIIDSINPKQKVKYVKKDRGLIERTSKEEDKIILAEDNRQILLG